MAKKATIPQDVRITPRELKEHGVRYVLDKVRRSKGYFMTNTERDLSQSDFKNRVLPHTQLLVAEERNACGYFSIEISGGASRIELRLPRPRATVRIRIGAGASHVQLIRPAGVPVRVHIGAGASNLAIDDFCGSGRIDWRSPDYDKLEGRYDIEIGAGASNLAVRT